MIQSYIFSICAILAISASALYYAKKPIEQGITFWSLLGAALAGSLGWSFYQVFSDEWRTSYSLAIWASISATILVFTITCRLDRQAQRLLPLVMPYMTLLGLWACIWQAFPGQAITQQSGPLSHWILFHIAVSLLTYGLATIAAIAALSAFLVENALKKKKPTRLSKTLPSIIDSEKLTVRLLLAAEVILALGIFSGMGLLLMEKGMLFALDHKTLFSWAAFILIALILWSHHSTGIRGKKVVRLVLVAYLLLSLGFLGVKFVTDIMMA